MVKVYLPYPFRMSALSSTAMSSRVSGGVTKSRGSYETKCREHSAFVQAVQELVESDTVGSSAGIRVSRRVQGRKIKAKQESKAEEIATPTPAPPSSQQARQVIAALAEQDSDIARLLFIINWKY